MKICTKCKIEKDTNEFSKDTSKVGGLCCQCKKCKGKQEKKYYNLNKDKIKLQQKKYHLLNPELRKQYKKEKFYNDVNFKILVCLRSRLYYALKEKVKSVRTMTLLGCKIEKIKEYLESKFQSGMSWKNYGKWHIDHIKPCVSFDLSKESEQYKCFHYTNLQPLWADENWRKGGKDA